MVYKNKRLGLGLLLTIWFLAPGPLAPPAAANLITSTQDWQIVSRLTGPNLTGKVGVGGTDLGHMVNHNGKTYFLFGDTFASEASGGSGGPDWRQNVMAYSTDFTPSNGISFDGWITRPNGTAKQVIVPGNQPVTYIPTGAISVGDKIYAWYMHVSDWNGWTLDHAGLARWREGDSQFTTVPNYRFMNPNGPVYTTGNGTQGPGNFGMVAASRRSPAENSNDNHIYIWGTPGGRRGGVKLARVLPAQIENKAAYEYFDGEVGGVPQWTDNEFDAEKIIQNNVGEMSVMYNEAVGAWTLMYQNASNGAFQIRQSDTPWGQWSDPVTVTQFSQAPGLYAPYMNPLYVENGGKTLYFTMSLWNPYDVYLAKVELDLDLQSRWAENIGNWATDLNWTHGQPAIEQRAVLNNGGTIQLNTVESVRAFDIGTGDGLGGRIAIATGADLKLHDGGFRVGVAKGSDGTLAMSGGSVEVLSPARLFIVGDSGNGTATMGGGAISARTFSIAHQPTGTGHLNLSGNAVITVTGDRFQMGRLRNASTGERSVASLTMSGGTINVNVGPSGLADFVPGWEGVATVNMSGGTINVGNNFVAAVAGASDQAPPSQATIIHSGGTINTGGMILGERGISNYTLSGTGVINARGAMRLGWFPTAASVFTQTGGTVNLALNNPAPAFVGLKIGHFSVYRSAMQRSSSTSSRGPPRW